MTIHGTKVKATPYGHPPITEAVIEIKFSTPLESNVFEKLNRKFNKNYPEDKAIRNVLVSLTVTGGNPHPQPSASEGTSGHRRSSSDMTELLVWWPNSFVASQLAPYPGWDVFMARFTRDWKASKRSRGFREINRVGVRFINRIDIPIDNGTVEHEQYLNIYPKLPDSIEAVDSYAVQTLSRIDDIHCILTINSASVPSPVLGFASFILDIDIAKVADLPQNDRELFQLLDQIRDWKNRIFEDCIDQKARRLF